MALGATGVAALARCNTRRVARTTIRAAASAAQLLALAGCAGDEPRATEPSGEARTEARAQAPEGSAAQRRDRGVRLVRFARFDAPIYVTAPPRDRRRVFVVERAGRVRIVRDGRTLSRPFLDISSDVSTDGERGLLSIAFAPDYEQSGTVYAYFNDRTGDVRIDELTRASGDANRVDPGTRREVIRVEHRRFSNHNGGTVQFGPDGLLYAAPGDGGGGGDPFKAGQDLGTLLGKLIRIDPRARAGRPYRVPRDNPFVSRQGARSEIYAYGLRNTYRFSFDRRSGDLTIADNGQEVVEEVDYARRGRGSGANFGWSVFEASRRFSGGSAPGHVRPVIERPHDSGVCSIIGGYVVRDRALGRAYGRYVYGDLCTGEVRSARLRTPRARGDRPLGVARVEGVVSFGEDGRGRVYVVAMGGQVYRLAAR